jgi:hypothetical protein
MIIALPLEVNFARRRFEAPSKRTLNAARLSECIHVACCAGEGLA